MLHHTRYIRVSGGVHWVARVLDGSADHCWFDANPWTKVGMLAHCSHSSSWISGENTWKVKGSEEGNWPP